MYLFAGCTLLFAFGSFRSRMTALRRLCHDLEVGEPGMPLGAIADRRPDDLSLLARSVDDMRHRLIELIGGSTLLRMLLSPDEPLDDAWVDQTTAILVHGVTRDSGSGR